ncbi:hypothetical protein DPMN_157006 [Dreissena polymorpha]|uniref:Uncharacterized protein n=1 Tax=Dreissena polymorpha TaxID=45954 RepID=A0A9D4JCY6_DREPO|nr:hypothetical protein DPMN_157006 [Dreissena polymorpha]
MFLQGIIDIQDAFSISYTIAVSNDGVNYGEEKHAYVYNSLCQRIEEPENKKIVLVAAV